MAKTSEKQTGIDEPQVEVVKSEKIEEADRVEEAGSKEIADPGSAFKRVDQTQGHYDDSALQDSLAELGRSEAQRVEDEKPR